MSDKENLSWLEERMILRMVTGSRSYGTNIEGSDWDFKGVVIPPIDYYLGLKTFNEYNTSTGKNFQNTSDDVDLVVMHVNKFVSNCVAGSPNTLELLFLREEDYLHKTELGQLLIDNKELFLSKRVKNRFGGYAKSQAKKMLNNKNRIDDTVGYDTKSFMHSVRLYQVLFDILEDGTFTTYRPNNEFLKELRLGAYTKDEAEQYLEELEAELQTKYEKSVLPSKVDYDKVNKLLIDINKAGLSL